MDETYLHFILDALKIDLLRSFVIKIVKYDHRRLKTSNKILRRIFSQINLRKLDFYIRYQGLKNLIWPTNCSIKQLTINEWINFYYLCQILKCCPQLKIFILTSGLNTMINGRILTPTLSPLFQQLRSLILERCDTDINILESFLKLMPSLIHLKVINENSDLISYMDIVGNKSFRNIYRN
ncbi:unnamed protein product [Rotaria sp. Silwood2]|nr:unnamed protein product [Rotaria sp. Silwood2]CAF2843288.1 unnamed protein product [Rotaria sp. Silwood2]CAF3205608.1 unnamed protein product [Rotaria sp. Silwood2]CAF3324851.1 unnamed protein product [Rotaria sp. Silwood2]CAF4136737.1 unnamed protein product [Rotaria sp. Silwood2]